MKTLLKSSLLCASLFLFNVNANATDIPVVAGHKSALQHEAPSAQIEAATVGGWLAKQADPNVDPLPADAMSVIATQGIMGSALSTLGVVALVGVAAKLIIQHEQRVAAQERQQEIDRRLQAQPIYAPLPTRAVDFGNARHDYRAAR